MTSLSALATLPAVPVQVAGRRAEKSPRLTAVITLSRTRGSISFSTTTLLGMCCDSSPLVRPLVSPPSVCCRHSLVDRDPELNARARPRLALNSAPASGQLRPLAYGRQSEMARDVHRLGDDEALAVIDHNH